MDDGPTKNEIILSIADAPSSVKRYLQAGW
jgi:hypothetical protein